MNPVWRDRLTALAAAVLGVWVAFHIADESWLLPTLLGSLALAAILIRFTSVEIDVLALGGLLVGYIVGNRGFAQFMPVPGLPLLPAEAGLATAGICLLWRSARDRTLPWRRDSLNLALLAFVIVGASRFVVDFPRHGFVALRDFAMVYYVAFFFATQELCREERRRRFLLACLLSAAALLPVVFTLFELFPDFFLGPLTLRGVPFIFFKGDLAPTFFAVGGIVLFLAAPVGHRLWARPLATGMVLWVFASDNRASMLGALVALAWLAWSRFRRFTLLQGGVLALALLLLAAFAGLGDNAWAERKVRSLADRAISVVDVTGAFSYRHDEGDIKSGNNQFRWVWWRSVAGETMSANPLLGLGFGHDLAHGFLQRYNPELADDFSARSPHNIFVTTFGRLGAVGVAILGWAFAVLTVRTFRVTRDPQRDVVQVALWAALWPIAISSLLGVVLEGPMGAVVFWVLLGIANACYHTPPAAPAEAEPAGADAPGDASAGTADAAIVASAAGR